MIFSNISARFEKDFESSLTSTSACVSDNEPVSSACAINSGEIFSIRRSHTRKTQRALDSFDHHPAIQSVLFVYLLVDFLPCESHIAYKPL